VIVGIGPGQALAVSPDPPRIAIRDGKLRVGFGEQVIFEDHDASDGVNAMILQPLHELRRVFKRHTSISPNFLRHGHLGGECEVALVSLESITSALKLGGLESFLAWSRNSSLATRCTRRRTL
jgi:hypothetical protein